MSLTTEELVAINKLIVEHNRLASYVVNVSDMIRTYQYPWYVRLYMWIRPLPFPSGKPKLVMPMRQDGIVPNRTSLDDIVPVIDNDSDDDDVTYVFDRMRKRVR